jgi:hypothetical protein
MALGMEHRASIAEDEDDVDDVSPRSDDEAMVGSG